MGPSLSELSRKQLVGLVYVGISLVIVGLASVETQAQVQWFASVASLSPQVDHVSFSFVGFDKGFALVNASVENPSSSRDLTVTYSETLFVNSSTTNATTEYFTVQGSSEVAVFGNPIAKTIPPHGSIRLDANMTLFSDVVTPLHDFLQLHPNPRIFVQLSLGLASSFGSFVPQYCYEVPRQPVLQCPAIRSSPVRGGGAGGG
jgi:hypothetical protein